jgi:hypothetical protein
MVRLLFPCVERLMLYSVLILTESIPDHHIETKVYTSKNAMGVDLHMTRNIT